MSRLLVASLVLSMACASRPAPQFTARGGPQEEATQTEVVATLLSLQVAMAQEPMSADHKAALDAWAQRGLNVFKKGGTAQDWEAEVRPTWLSVRSMLGPYEGLQTFIPKLGSLIE